MSSPIEFKRGLLARHFEELDFLLAQRASALNSTSYDLESLRDLEERIDAHLDALILGDDDGLPLLKEAIAGDDPGPVAAATLVLLWLSQPVASQLVIDALKAAPNPKAKAIAWALCQGPIAKVAVELQSIADAGEPAAAAAAAEALAYHKGLKVDESKLTALSMSDDPQIRAATWRVAALL